MTREPGLSRPGRGIGRKLGTVAIVVGIVAVFALLRPPSDRSRPDTVLVLCGGSMRAPLEEIVERYKAVSSDAVVVSYGDSGVLCAQIKDTSRGDIFICHDPFMEWAAKQGLIAAWTAVGRLEVATVVPKGNPKNIHTLEDLARPGLRLGVGNQHYSTAGVIVRHMLDKLPFGQAVRANIRSETKGHQERCQDVAEGHLDAGIVWSAVARLFVDQVDIIPIPKNYIDAISSATYGVSDLKNVKVTVGITATAKDKERARRFYEFATKDCADVWAKHGFTPEETVVDGS